MSCPNSNKQFDNFLSFFINKNVSSSQKAYERRRLYYTVCIIFRLFIAGLLLQLRDKPWLPYIVAFITGYSIINLIFFRTQDNQWWSNNFSLTMSIIMFITSILLIFKVNITTYSLPFLFLSTIMGGFFNSLTQKSC